MTAYYPVFLDIRNRHCVVFGGGDIGAEKVFKLLEYGAKVTVISPEINETLYKVIDDHLSWIQRKYQRGDLDGAFIAIIVDTSDNAINKSIYDEAKTKNVPLNVSDIPSLCTWIAPSIARRGDVILATSTGGASPALARRFREELSGTNRVKSQRDIMDYADLAPLLSHARQKLTRQGIKLNLDHWQICLTDDLVDLVQAGKSEEASAMLMSRLLVGTECECPENTCKIWEDLGQSTGEDNHQMSSSHN